MQEMLDIYHNDLKKIGILPRNVAHQSGKLHAVCHLYVIDSRQNLLYLQQRASHKDSHPNDFDITCAGHMDPYETPVQTILREANEEIGLDLKAADLLFLGARIETFGLDHELAYIFLVDVDNPHFHIGDEVQQIIGVDIDAFLSDQYITQTGITLPIHDLCEHDLSLIKEALLHREILATDKELCIRKAYPYDAPLLCTWWNDGKIMAHAGFPNGIHTTIKEVKQGLNNPNKRYIIEANYQPIGEMCYREVDHQTVEIGIKIVDVNSQNCGYGTRLLKIFCHYLFQNYHRITLTTSSSNQHARHVYQKLGFQMIDWHQDAFKDELGQTYTCVDYILDFAHFKM